MWTVGIEELESLFELLPLLLCELVSLTEHPNPSYVANHLPM